MSSTVSLSMGISVCCLYMLCGGDVFASVKLSNPTAIIWGLIKLHIILV